MSRTRLSLQATLVFTVIAVVSGPDFRTVRPASVWRYAPEALLAMEAQELEQYQFGDAAPEGTGSARTDGDSAPSFVVPLKVLETGGTLNAITGSARTSLNRPLPNVRVLLRDIRTGAIEARATTTREGNYSFVDVDASAYVVELIGPDGRVVAASEMVALAHGDLRETTLRVSANALTTAVAFGGRLTGVLGDSVTADNPLSEAGLTRTADTLTQVANVSPLR